MSAPTTTAPSTTPAPTTSPAYSAWDVMMIEYGSAHQNRVNVWMHIAGVPVIVFGLLAMVAGGTDVVLGLPIGAAAVAVAGIAWYARLEKGLATIAAPVFLLLAVLAEVLAGAQGATTAMVVGAALFIGGFVFQFIGHAIEGAKPALMNGNPIIAMLTAPLFIVAELLFLAGRRHDLETTMREGIARLEAGLPVTRA